MPNDAPPSELQNTPGGDRTAGQIDEDRGPERSPYNAIGPDVGPNSPNSVNIASIQSVSAISAVGLVAARMLQQHRIATLMVGDGGTIEVVPPGELELDSLDEQSALQELVSRRYSDQQMVDYLRQRAVRKAL